MKHVFIITLMGAEMCVFPFNLSDAIGQDVGGLKQSKDVPGLMRLLRHHDGRIRSSAAVTLSQVIREVEDSESLAPYGIKQELLAAETGATAARMNGQ